MNIKCIILFSILAASKQQDTDVYCRSDQFACKNGDCIKQEQRCNGNNDCSDNSDEINCSNTCASDLFACKNGNGCINKDKVCDGKAHCEDSSDEQKCDEGCRNDEFECKTIGYCIERKQLCDGRANCADKSDETYLACSENKCINQNEFRCNYGACIESSLRCNDNNDCIDGSDEQDCLRNRCKSINLKTLSGAISVECFSKNKVQMGCNRHQYEQGTRIHFYCANDTVLSDRDNGWRLCMKSGRWNRPLPRCQNVCGRVYNNSNIVPWSLNVYKATNLELVCGASLISPTISVSAAHCFSILSKLNNPDEFRIGNQTIRWEMYNISIPTNYKGINNYFESDLAIIKHARVEIGPNLQPICIRTHRQFYHNDELMIKGLESIFYTEKSQCVLNGNFASFLTDDRLCARLSNANIKPGDSGTGVIVYDSTIKKYELVGIVSILPNQTYILFTNINYHYEYINKHLN